MWVYTANKMGRDSVVGIATVTGWKIRGSSSGGWRDYPHSSLPALRPVQPSPQWVPGLSFGDKATRSVALTTNRHLLPSSKQGYSYRECIGSWWGDRREGDHWGDLGVDGWIILGRICRRWDVDIWTGLGWSRIGTGGGRL